MLSIDYGIGADPLPVPTFMPSWIFWRWLWPSVHGFSKYFTEFAGRLKQGQVPDWKGWDYLNKRLSLYCEFDSADLALPLYYYYTYRRQIDRADYEKGITGYTGVLQQMIAEVPTRGTDRLVRKLSVDVNKLIPLVFRDLRGSRG
jgi:hypothetical protein